MVKNLDKIIMSVIEEIGPEHAYVSDSKLSDLLAALTTYNDKRGSCWGTICFYDDGSGYVWDNMEERELLRFEDAKDAYKLLIGS